MKNQWLDNYGEEANYNDSKVTLPEGYVGYGYDTKGRNYSPAWGGQFQNGGGLWKTDKRAFVDSTLQANRNKDFVKRLYTDQYGSIPTPKNLPDYKPGMRSTHLMAYDPDSKRVYPEVVHSNGKLQYLTGDNAWDYADRTGEYITFKTPEQAAWFADSPNSTTGYKMGTGVFGNKPPKKQMGGSIPGAVGFAYARTDGAAPANGKYAKKTTPSAQNGTTKKYSELPYNEQDIKSFYNKMITSPWYKQRLINNDYDKQYSIGIDNIIKNRLQRVNDAKLDNVQADDKLLNQAYRFLTSGEVVKPGGGSYYNPDNKRITMVESQMNELKAHPRTILAHEFGHPEVEGGISRVEQDLLTKFNPKPLKKLIDHDKSPSENKSDINSLRYNLYKANIFNPDTGKYKTPSGKFDDSLFEKIKDDAAVKRLRNNYGDKYLIDLVNIVADNSQNEFTPIAQDGTIVKDNNGYWNPENWGKVVEIDSNNITMQGVDQPLLGVSDEGDVQYMEPGEDYKFKGKKVTEYPVAQKGKSIKTSEIDNIKKFYNDVYNSDWYRDRLMSNGYGDVGKKNSTYLGNIKKVSEIDNIINDRKKLLKDLKYKEESSMNVSKTPWIPSNGSYYDSNDNVVIFDPNQAYNLNAYPQSVIAHEIGHNETEANRLSKYERKLLSRKLNHWDPGIDSHDRDPYENKSDINAVRYNLYKKGLFDPNTGEYKTKSKKFENNLLNSIKDDFSTHRLQRNYTKDNLEYLINTIADNSDSELIPVAKNGINNLDENSLQKLDQLTNFTNYNTKQPGGWLDSYK